MLWLLKLNGSDVGIKQWLEVAESWCKYDHLRQCSFTDLHTVMVYSELGRIYLINLISQTVYFLLTHPLTKSSLIAASHGLDKWREKAEQLIAPIAAGDDNSTSVHIDLLTERRFYDIVGILLLTCTNCCISD